MRKGETMINIRDYEKTATGTLPASEMTFAGSSKVVKQGVCRKNGTYTTYGTDR
jgi:hypothetical protein